MTGNFDEPHIHDDDADGCLCDIENDPAEMTGDEDLPAASGGVLVDAASAGEEDDDVCGFDVTEATADEDLPAAVGGVG